jgi:hypothetical protein
MKRYFFCLLLVFTVFSTTADWNTPENGNPILPGYTADPSILYDSSTATFFVYSTSDGIWISYSGNPQVAYSKDFINWKFKPLILPSFWPKVQLWAPSAIRHPTNGKYYLMYCIGNAAYIAFSESPFGPWTNAASSNVPLYQSGNLTGSSDWIDPQFFIDTSTVYITFGQGSNMGIAKLAFDPSTFKVTFDGSDKRMIDGVTYKCKRLAGLSNNLEGSCMFKKDGRYFITYSNSACQNYNVQYAVSASPVGPFTYINKIIVQRDKTKNILGPGHNSILHYGNNWYICYHRQHYQYVDVKRQTCIDQLTFRGDTISALVQSQTGVFAGSGSLETFVSENIKKQETDLAFDKSVIASSESAFKGGTARNQSETFASVSNFYQGKYAVDHNNGTRWAPSTLPGYLIVDLGKEYQCGRCETTFEMVMRLYKYRIEYLSQSDAADITAAKNSTKWILYADRSNNTESVSPVVDSLSVSARYFKLTLLSANLPTDNAEVSTILETDYADRVSVFEFKVFAENKTSIKYIDAASQKKQSVNDIFCLVNGDNRVSFELFDPSGRVVLWKQNIDVSEARRAVEKDVSVQSGVYLLRVKTSEGYKLERIPLHLRQ